VARDNEERLYGREIGKTRNTEAFWNENFEVRLLKASRTIRKGSLKSSAKRSPLTMSGNWETVASARWEKRGRKVNGKTYLKKN